MNEKEKTKLMTRNSEEIMGKEHIKEKLKSSSLKIYCGYEPSGPIHIGTLVTILKLLDFQKAGITPIVLLADWHAFLNKKGDWNFLKEQVNNWKRGIKATGLKPKFITGTSFQKKPEYIQDVLTLSLNTTINRGLRSMQTITRETENAKISQIIYPLMQVADIKNLNIDFAIGGIDQRKIHALATETLSKINFKKNPVFIHTGIISSLKGPGSKMSSSVQEGMISIKDSKTEIEKKIKKAHCPEGETKENPILEITKLLLFPKFNNFKLSRSEKFGGDKTYDSYEELEKDFSSKKIHPLDLKNSVSIYLNELIEPIRKAWE